MRRRTLRYLGGLFALALGLAGVPGGEARAQTVEFQEGSRGLPRADAAVRRVLSRGEYVVWVRDTVLAAGERVAGDVILIGSTLHVEGIIAGDLVAVQSDVFTRPGGEIGGTVIVLGGGFYGSSLARLASPPIDASLYEYGVEPLRGGRYVIAAPGGGARLRLRGLYGFLVPDYDRVNALTLSWAVRLDRGRSAWLPDASATLRYRSVRTVIDGVIALAWPFARHAAVLEGGRTVRSNDRWINADPINSLSSIWAGGDYRNYYDARYVEGGVRLEYGMQTLWKHSLLLGWERARSLDNRDPFSIFDYRGPFGPNLPVDEADIVSLKLESSARLWTLDRSSGRVELSFEYADADIAGDVSFALVGAALAGDIPTFGRHYVRVLARAQVPASDDAPAQRWRALGGWGTLPTLDAVSRAGDRMWFVEATYLFPTGLTAAVLGELAPWLRYAGGNAWIGRSSGASVVNNVGLGLTLGIFEAGLFVDPGADFRTVFMIGLTPRP